MDTNNPTPTNNSPDDLASQYQDILKKYAQDIQKSIPTDDTLPEVPSPGPQTSENLLNLETATDNSLPSHPVAEESVELKDDLDTESIPVDEFYTKNPGTPLMPENLNIKYPELRTQENEPQESPLENNTNPPADFPMPEFKAASTENLITPPISEPELALPPSPTAPELSLPSSPAVEAHEPSLPPVQSDNFFEDVNKNSPLPEKSILDDIQPTPPVSSSASAPVKPSVTLEDILKEEPKLPQPPAEVPHSENLMSSTPTHTGPNFFKFFFVFTLILFLAVAAAFAYYYFYLQPKAPASTVSNNNTVPTQGEEQVCKLNDKTYAVGETIPAEDGCNSCSCSADLTMQCTAMACSSSSTSLESIKSNLQVVLNKTGTKSDITSSTFNWNIGEDKKQLTGYQIMNENLTKTTIEKLRQSLISTFKLVSDPHNTGDGPSQWIEGYSSATVVCTLSGNEERVIAICAPAPSSSVSSTSIAPTTTLTPSSSIPKDLQTAIVNKYNSALSSSDAKLTVNDLVFGDAKIIGNFAQVAYSLKQGGGAIMWFKKSGTTWQFVTGGQEPPKCSTLAKYSFPSEFECNQ